MTNLWIEGSSRSGKTDRLAAEFLTWAETEFANQPNPQAASQSVLLFAIDADRRKQLSDRFTELTHGRFPVTAVTPNSFFRDRVLLFWSLLIKELALKPQFPILLRVENEQELATRLWSELLDRGLLRMEGTSATRVVRRLLDLYLLAANSGKAIADLPDILTHGMEMGGGIAEGLWENVRDALAAWEKFCHENGLLTYGIITKLFGRHLLPHPRFREDLCWRYRYVMVDNADEFPAIVRDVCALLLDRGARGAFTFNPHGASRLGLGADPDAWQAIAARCQTIALAPRWGTVAATLTQPVLEAVMETETMGFAYGASAPLAGLLAIGREPEIYSRAALLRAVGDRIGELVHSGAAQPDEIAIIAPGLDNIASYALTEILRKKGIAITALDDQRPLVTSVQVRSLLTLLGFVYPRLGHLMQREQVAEMLVALGPQIDPVRAGLLADRCFAPHPDRPKLLKSDTFSQWNRLGHQVTQDYETLRAWLEQQSPAIAPLLLLERAIQTFILPAQANSDNYDLLKTLQELMETAQHYWQLGYRLGWTEAAILERFIALIRQGIVTANPYVPKTPNASVTLATIYQYRMSRQHHRIAFWLDAGSPLWRQGGAAALFAAPLFLQNWTGEPWTIVEENAADSDRLRRVLQDLLLRVDEYVVLCFSELSASGQLQTGPLLALADLASAPVA